MADERIQVVVDYSLIEKAINKLSELKSAISKMNDNTIKLKVDENGISAIEKKVSSLKSEISSLENKKVSISTDNKGLDETVQKVRETKTELNSLEKVGLGMRNVGNGFYQFGNALDQFGDSLSVVDSLMTNIVQKGVELGKTVLTGAGGILSNYVQTGITSADSMLTLKNSLGGFLQNDDLTRQVLKRINDTLVESPLSDQSILTNFQRYLSTTNGDVEKSFKLQSMLQDISGATGADYNRLGLAITQIMQYGKLRAQEYNQLTENGVGGIFKREVEKIYRERGGQSEWSDAQADGELTADIFWEVLENMTKEGGLAYKGLEKATRTITGLMEKAKGEIQSRAKQFIGMNEFGDIEKGSFLEMFMGSFDKLMEKFDEFSKTDTYARIKQGLIDITRQAMDFIMNFDFQKAEQNIRYFVTGFKREFRNIMQDETVQYVIQKLKELKQYITELGNGNFAQGLGSFSAKFIKAFANIKMAKIGTELLAGTLPLIGSITGNAGRILNLIGKKAGDKLGRQTAEQMAEGMKEGITKSSSSFAGKISGAFSKATGVLDKAFNLAIKGAFAGILVDASVWLGLETLKRLQSEMKGIDFFEMTQKIIAFEGLQTELMVASGIRGFVGGALTGQGGVIGVATDAIMSIATFVSTVTSANSLEIIRKANLNGVAPKIKQFSELVPELRKVFDGKPIISVGGFDIFGPNGKGDVAGKLLGMLGTLFDSISSFFENQDLEHKLSQIKNITKAVDGIRELKPMLEEISKYDFTSLSEPIKKSLKSLVEIIDVMNFDETKTNNRGNAVGKLDISSEVLQHISNVKTGLTDLKTAFESFKQLSSIIDELKMYDESFLITHDRIVKSVKSLKETIAKIDELLNESYEETTYKGTKKRKSGQRYDNDITRRSNDGVESTNTILEEAKQKINLIKDTFTALKELIAQANAEIKPEDIAKAVDNINRSILTSIEQIDNLGASIYGGFIQHGVSGVLAHENRSSVTGPEMLQTNSASYQEIVPTNVKDQPYESNIGLEQLFTAVNDRVNKIKQIFEKLQEISDLGTIDITPTLTSINSALDGLTQFIGGTTDIPSADSLESKTNAIAVGFKSISDNIVLAIIQLEQFSTPLVDMLETNNPKLVEMKTNWDNIAKAISGARSSLADFVRYFVDNVTPLPAKVAEIGASIRDNFNTAIQGMSSQALTEINMIQNALNSLSVPNLNAEVNYKVNDTASSSTRSIGGATPIPTVGSITPSGVQAIATRSTSVINNYYTTTSSNPTINQNINSATQSYTLGRASSFLRGL